MKPKLEYDAAANAAYIRFSTEAVQETEEVSEGIMLDYDRDGRIVGLEVLNARAHLPAAALDMPPRPHSVSRDQEPFTPNTDAD
ncbi:MAG: DUF2283 domain-containing protein [Allorhizobium sp.]